MGLITVDDVEIALGRDLVGAEAAQVDYYIDAWSGYIESYTGTFFTEHTDEIKRLQADYYGLIDFKFGPVTDVTSILSPTGSPIWCAQWDYLNTIYGLYPNQVVDVTLTYGYADVPADIANFCTSAVVDTMDNPGGMTAHRVGDVTEDYSGNWSARPPINFQSMGTAVLDSYRITETTWRIGPREFPPPAFLPF